MKWLLLIVGATIGALPTAVRGVWDGQSLLGLVIVLIAAGWILRTEIMDDESED